MASVTVFGAHGSTVSLSYDSAQNALLAQQIAGAFSAAVSGGTVQPADSKYGPPPPLAPGATGEFVASTNSVTFLPHGYTDVVNAAAAAVVFGSGGANQQILSGSGNLSFVTTEGNGTVVAGGGNNQIVVAAGDSGGWQIDTGNGNDMIRALGAGNDTIAAGGGNNYLQLGAGKDQIITQGADTILGGTGAETVVASATGGQHATDLIYGNASMLFLVAANGATVLGGSGSDTVYGGTGPDLLYGGTAGSNFLQAGSGAATLFGGGNNDQLYAGGSAAQALHAATGNESLFGGGASGQDTFYTGSGADQVTGSGGQSTFVFGTGAATVTALPSSSFQAVFEAIKGQAGGTDLVQGLTNASQLQVVLSGYGPNEAASALAGQTTNGSSVTITLSDNTQITFANIAHLTTSNFS
ncbi:MAG TPA: calcium-binding protein [Acetobacteraceae bacterium]|nr:calcium-binding protein [Acetobacteraceae bacterium]